MTEERENTETSSERKPEEQRTEESRRDEERREEPKPESNRPEERPSSQDRPRPAMVTPMRRSNPENETVTFKKETLWKTSTFVLTGVVIILAGIMIFGGGNPTGGAIAPTGGDPTPTPTPTPGQGGTPEPGAISVDADDDAILGDENAPVTLIEFSDYECPFCGRFWELTLPEIKSEYIETGQVKFVYRDFPLDSIHPLARPAAIATECVHAEGGDEAFFEMHDQIFGNQQSLSIDNLKMWAEDIGYDISDCLDNEEFDDEVTKDLQDATAAGGRGTPFFIVLDSEGNGIPISGAQPYSAFKAAIDAALEA